MINTRVTITGGDDCDKHERGDKHRTPVRSSAQLDPKQSSLLTLQFIGNFTVTFTVIPSIQTIPDSFRNILENNSSKELRNYINPYPFYTVNSYIHHKITENTITFAMLSSSTIFCALLSTKRA